MKKFIIFTLFILSLTTYSQWASNYGGNQGDVNYDNAKGTAIAVDNAGYSYVTGYCNEILTGNDIVTIKYSPLGAVVWAVDYNGSMNSNDEGTGVCVDSDGNVYVVGTSQNTNKYYDLTIIKYDANGDTVWTRTYSQDVGAYREDRGLGIAVDSEGNIYVTGFGTNEDDIQNIITQKNDSEGALQWTAVEDGEDGLNSRGLCIAVSSSGNIYVSGYVTTNDFNMDIAVIAYNNDGTQSWISTANGSGNGQDQAWGIAVDASDNVFITGFTTVSEGNTDCFTAKYDSSGNTLWTMGYGGNSMDKAWGLVVDTDGSVYITGESTDDDGNVNYITIRYDSEGTEVWATLYDGTGEATDVATAIGIVTANNNRYIVVTGKSWGTAENFDYATVRYDMTSCNVVQTNRYSMSGVTNDIAKDVAAANGKVYITGFSQLIIDAPSQASSYISTIMINMGNSSELTIKNNTPEKFSLYQNYPNPFNPATTIKFDITKAGIVKLVIYDILGKVIDVLVNQNMQAGTHTISYVNASLSSGVYFYDLTTGNQRDIKKMTLIK